MSADLAATVAALKDGDRVRATFHYDRVIVTVEGQVTIDGPSAFIPGGCALREREGSLTNNLTAVEVLAPALPPCPFEMGDRVWLPAQPIYGEFIVDGWEWVGCRGRAEVSAHSEDGKSGISVPPDELRLVPALPPEPRVGSGVFYDGRLWVRGLDGRWYCVIDRMWEPRTWAEIQPCVPAVPAYLLEDAVTEAQMAASAPLSTDEPDVPVGSLAVFRTGRVVPLMTVMKHDDGNWIDKRWGYWTDKYGAPVAVIPAGGE